MVVNKEWIVAICSVAAFLLLPVVDVGAAYRDYVHVGYQPYRGGDPDNGTDIPAWGSYTYDTDTPALEIRPGPLEAGSRFSLGIVLKQNIDEAFDFYIVADTQFGCYTLHHRGRVEKGVKALYSNVPRYGAAVETTTTNALPNTMSGVLVTFYTVVVQAGKIPPISNLDQLTENTRYVIMMDSRAVTIQ